MYDAKKIMSKMSFWLEVLKEVKRRLSTRDRFDLMESTFDVLDRKGIKLDCDELIELEEDPVIGFNMLKFHLLLIAMVLKDRLLSIDELADRLDTDELRIGLI